MQKENSTYSDSKCLIFALDYRRKSPCKCDLTCETSWGFLHSKPQSFKEEKVSEHIHLLPSASFPSAHPAGCHPAAAAWAQCTPPGWRRPSCWCLSSPGCSGRGKSGTAGAFCWAPEDHRVPWWRKEETKNRMEISLAVFHFFNICSLFFLNWSDWKSRSGFCTAHRWRTLGIFCKKLHSEKKQPCACC